MNQITNVIVVVSQKKLVKINIEMVKLKGLYNEIRVIQGLKNSSKYPINKILNLASKEEYNDQNGQEYTMIGFGNNSNVEWEEIQEFLEDILVNEYKLGTPEEVANFMKKIYYNNATEDDDEYESALNNFYNRYKSISIINLIQDFMKFKQQK